MSKMVRLSLQFLFVTTFLGCSLWTTDAPTDMEDEHESVVKSLGKSCKKGNAISCSNLAYMYENGQGVSRDFDRAMSLYGKACQNGESQACEKIK